MDSSSKQMTSKDKTVRPKTPVPRSNRAVARKSFPTTSKKAAESTHTKKSSELSNVVSLSEDDDEINDAPSVGDANKTHTASPTILVRSSSSDEAMTVGDRNTLSLTKRKRSASSEKKSTSQSSSASSNVKSTVSSATATASSSKKGGPSSSKAKKSITSSASTSSSNASESSGDNEPPRTRKRTAPKEDAARPSKVKRNSRRNWDDDSEDEYSPTGCRYKSPRREFGSRRMRDGFDCKICSRSFKGMTDLRRHLLIHAGEKPHVCEVCNKAYRQYVNLRNHMKVEHSKGKEFKCPFCMKPFALKLRLKLHLRIHIGEKPYICPNCPKTFAQEQQLTQHLKCHEVMAKNTCNLCSAKFPNEKAFKLHMETHADEDIDEILCQICDSTFESENVMVSHMTSSHGDLTHFECQICEKQIQDDLETHMKTHAPAKPHQCKICKKQFSQKNQHIIHMRTHTGERPYQCRVCWQSFGHSNVLKLHIRKHTGEKPFKCILCTTPTAFSQLAHLKGHLKSIHNHEGAYFCVGCKGSFKKKFLLDEHVKTCDEVEFQGPTKEEKKNAEKEADQLAQLRYLMAVLLKKISSKEKLDILGFEKRLIDNVVIAALELSGHKACNNKKVNPLDQMKLNIEAFLEWTVPKKIMHQFKKECPTIESILEKIVALYLKQVE